MKKLISIILVFLMIASALTVTGGAVNDSGSCGDNLAWTYNGTTKVLTVSGSGAMYDFTAKEVPWKAYRAATLIVVIEPGTTYIGEYAFYFFSSATDVIIPASVTDIGASAFNYALSLTSVRYTGSAEQWQDINIGASNSYLSYAAVEYLTDCEAYGHSVVISSSEAATCTAGGYEEGVCSVCGAEIYTAIPERGHYFTATAAVDETHYTRTCSRCGTTESLVCEEGTRFSIFGGTVGAGETFEVPVFMTGNPGIWSAKVYVYFKPGFDVLSMTNGTVFPNSETILNPEVNNAASDQRSATAFSERGVDVSDYNCVCAYFQKDDLYTDNTSNGLLFTVTMKAPDEGGEFVLGVLDSPSDVFNCDVTDVPFLFSDSTVTVLGKDPHAHEWGEGVVTLQPTTTENGLRTYTCSVCGRTKTEAIPAIPYYPGDIDGDGKVNVKDLTALKRLIVGSLQPWDVANADAADINNDGKYNTNDLRAIKRLIVGQQ